MGWPGPLAKRLNILYKNTLQERIWYHQLRSLTHLLLQHVPLQEKGDASGGDGGAGRVRGPGYSL